MTNLYMQESVLRYIDTHYTEPISLDTVAASVGFSKCYISRHFKQYSDLNFSDYLNQRRLREARELLTNSAYSVTEIALLSGFQSIPSFNRTFKQSMHCTPTEYRIYHH